MITIAICTWNRAAMLDRLLTSFHSLIVPADIQYEFIVVNNNCTDNTDVILDKHSTLLPLKRSFEPTAGIAHARNRALLDARGDLMLWTDDDMAVPGNWLVNYLDAANKFPDASLFGGPIRAWFADDVASDVKQFATDHMDLLAPMFGLKDNGPDVRDLKPGETIFSGNMALRTAAAKRYRFNSDFGRVRRDGLMGGEETLFLQQMLDGGERGIWVGNAESQHYITADRLTRDYYWKYFTALGRTQGRMDGIPACPTLLGQPRWAVLQSLRERWASWSSRLAGGNWMPHYLQAAKLSGYLEECEAHRNGRQPGYLVPPHKPAVVADG
jgi:glycosyltransferase involved in cell wall biosynthesis